MKKYLVEFIGTFFLVLTVGLTGNPFAIGAILVAMVYMGGYISGAHYNPAVTLAVWSRGKMSFGEALRYIIVQLLAGFVVAGVILAMTTQKFIPKPDVRINYATVVAIELIYTFALASVVLHVATARRSADNQYFGLAIGMVLMAAVFVAGPVSGGVFNPAIAVGPMLFDYKNISANMNNLLIYTLAPIIGGLIAGFTYRLVSSDNERDLPQAKTVVAREVQPRSRTRQRTRQA